MSVKDRAKMFSNSKSDQDLQTGLLTINKTQSSSLSSPSIGSKISSFFSNMCNSIKTAFKDLWGNKKTRYIVIGVFSFVLLLLIIIIIASLASKNPKPSNEYESSSSNGKCTNPYNIKVYSDDLLKWNLTNCGYKEGTQLFNFALSAIKLHNLYRACHNAQPLFFNCDILKISQAYSDKLASQNSGLVHSNNRYNGQWMGENLAYFYGTDGEVPTKMWYDEYSAYDFNNPGFSMNTGHFTQVVWKNSKEFGIGYSCVNSRCYVTGNYFPGGNVGGQYQSNVQNLQ